MDFIAATKKLWDAYFFATESECYDMLDWCDPECVIIGTGRHEFYQNLQSFSEALANQIKERGSVNFQYKDFWCEQSKLTEDVCLVYGGLHIWWDSEDGNVSINMDSRFTLLYQYIDHRWKVVHLHQSIPSAEQGDGEYYPKRLLNQYYEEREKVRKLNMLVGQNLLTGLVNYPSFQKLFNDLVDQSIWLLVIDIDDFKSINDTYGHLFGNRALQALAGVFRDSVRAKDIVCRMGGDEFLILCSDVDSIQTMESLLERIKTNVVGVELEQGCRLSVSIGATAIGTMDSLENAFERADKALYEAKGAGKGIWKIKI